MDGMTGKPPEVPFDWAEMQAYHTPPLHSPAHEYGGILYPNVSPHEMHHEAAFGRPPQMYVASQQPQPLFATQWPSAMVTHASMQAPPQHAAQPPSQPGHHHPHVRPPLQPPLAPMDALSVAQGHYATMNAPQPLHPPPQATPQQQQSNVRRTLTDQDRRRMCQYHEDNPSVKQTEIGAMFGVERSTVSKVLRQKEKYLFTEDGSRSPIKKPKGKFPDIERALSNWVRNTERKGLALSDKDIREKAKFFAATVGSVDSYDKLNSVTWLEKFRQKNGLTTCKSRRGSESLDSDVTTEQESGTQTPNGISPRSPSGAASPSPISPSQSKERLRSELSSSNLSQELTHENHAHSQSGASLASGYSDTQPSSTISTRAQSPGSFYSSEASAPSSTYAASQPSQMMSANAANSHRIRSQTFPVLGLETMFGALPGAHGGNITPRQMQDIMSAPVLETPIEEYSERQYPLSATELQHYNHSSSGVHSPPVASSPSLMGPPGSVTPSTAAASMVSSPLVPPSQDEARRALELVMHFFQQQPSGVVDPEEYITMGKLMEKLKFQGSVGELPGGMRSINGGAHQEVSRKRSIHTL